MTDSPFLYAVARHGVDRCTPELPCLGGVNRRHVHRYGECFTSSAGRLGVTIDVGAGLWASTGVPR
jgi:hypothetical protein